MKKLVLITAIALSLFVTSCSSDDAAVLSEPVQTDADNILYMTAENVNAVSAVYWYSTNANPGAAQFFGQNSGNATLTNAQLLEKVEFRAISDTTTLDLTLNGSDMENLQLESGKRYMLTFKTENGLTVLGKFEKINN